MPVQYSSQKNFNHSSPQKIGILLVNLGTPDAPNTKKKYLKQFLSDPRVIELPRFFWFLSKIFFMPVQKYRTGSQKQKVFLEFFSLVFTRT